MEAVITIQNEVSEVHCRRRNSFQKKQIELFQRRQQCERCLAQDREYKKHEKYLLHSFQMHGFLGSDILRLSTLIDCSPKFTEYFKIILRREQS